MPGLRGFRLINPSPLFAIGPPLVNWHPVKLTERNCPISVEVFTVRMKVGASNGKNRQFFHRIEEADGAAQTDDLIGKHETQIKLPHFSNDPCQSKSPLPTISNMFAPRWGVGTILVSDNGLKRPPLMCRQPPHRPRHEIGIESAGTDCATTDEIEHLIEDP